MGVSRSGSSSACSTRLRSLSRLPPPSGTPSTDPPAFRMMSLGPLLVSSSKALASSSAVGSRRFLHYESLALDFELADNVVRSRMDSNRSRLIRDKKLKLKLFGPLCNDAGIRDDSLLATLVNGVCLTEEAFATIPSWRRLSTSLSDGRSAAHWRVPSKAARAAPVCRAGHERLEVEHCVHQGGH
jgi:hypothetical protein